MMSKQATAPRRRAGAHVFFLPIRSIAKQPTRYEGSSTAPNTTNHKSSFWSEDMGADTLTFNLCHDLNNSKLPRRQLPIKWPLRLANSIKLFYFQVILCLYVCFSRKGYSAISYRSRMFYYSCFISGYIKKEFQSKYFIICFTIKRSSVITLVDFTFTVCMYKK